MAGFWATDGLDVEWEKQEEVAITGADLMLDGTT